jgi:hypothetical protein
VQVFCIAVGVLLWGFSLSVAGCEPKHAHAQETDETTVTALLQTFVAEADFDAPADHAARIPTLLVSSLAAELLRAGDVEVSTSQFTFCSFSQLFKVSPIIAEAWATILEDAPTTKLVLFNHPPISQRGLLATNPRLLELFNNGRIVFADILPRAEYLLARRASCGLGLDTSPYNGHTSVADLLWAGVPVLTLTASDAGFGGRAAASLLAADRRWPAGRLPRASPAGQNPTCLGVRPPPARHPLGSVATAGWPKCRPRRNAAGPRPPGRPGRSRRSGRTPRQRSRSPEPPPRGLSDRQTPELGLAIRACFRTWPQRT